MKLEEIKAKVAQLSRQVSFVEELVRAKSEEAHRAYLIVVTNAHTLKKAAQNVSSRQEAKGLASEIRKSLDKLSIVRRRGFRVASSGTLAPSRHFGQVRSVEPTPPPGSGKRR